MNINVHVISTSVNINRRPTGSNPRGCRPQKLKKPFIIQGWLQKKMKWNIASGADGKIEVSCQ